MDRSTTALQLSLGNRLALARKAKGQTQAELAEKAGLSRATIAKIEAGDADPKLSTVSDLAKALDVSPMWLVMSEEDMEVIAEIAESGELDSILEMLPDELMAWVNSMIASGRKKNVREALSAVQSVFEETQETIEAVLDETEEAEEISSVSMGATPEGMSKNEMSSLLKAIAGAKTATSSTTAIGASVGSKIGTAIGTAWEKARAKVKDE